MDPDLGIALTRCYRRSTYRGMSTCRIDFGHPILTCAALKGDVQLVATLLSVSTESLVTNAERRSQIIESYIELLDRGRLFTVSADIRLSFEILRPVTLVSLLRRATEQEHDLILPHLRLKHRYTSAVEDAERPRKLMHQKLDDPLLGTVVPANKHCRIA
jgi:hypothetical protein